MHQIQLRDFPDDSPMAAFYHQHALMVLAYIRPHLYLAGRLHLPLPREAWVDRLVT